MRNSRRRRSDFKLMLRDSDRFSTTEPGPMMVLRPASPNVAGRGTENAAVLNQPVPPFSGSPVALARSAALDPVPSRLPETVAVCGAPDCALTEPESDQSFRALATNTGRDKNPLVASTGEASTKFNDKT